MAVEHWYPIHLCRYDEAGRRDALFRKATQDFPGLALDLGLFALDVGNHVAGDVHRRHSGIAGPGDRLQGHHRDAHQPESPLERRQRHCQKGGRAVRIGDDHARARKAPSLPLVRNQPKMVRVHLRHDERYVRLHSIGTGIAENGHTFFRPSRLHVPCDIRPESREGDVDIRRRSRVEDFELANRVRHGGGESPATGIAVPFPGRGRRSADTGQTKLGVVREKLDETLSDGSGGAQDGNRQRLAQFKLSDSCSTSF